MDFNINNYVKVKLTDIGRDLLKADHVKLFAGTSMAKYPYIPPKEDADGWSRWQLWDLMSKLGPHTRLGCNITFHPNIEIEETK